MVEEKVIYQYECKECGYIWNSNIKLDHPCCAKCISNFGKNGWFSVHPYHTSPTLADCCSGCSNNPKNGGSGICHCTIPYLYGDRKTTW